MASMASRRCVIIIPMKGRRHDIFAGGDFAGGGVSRWHTRAEWLDGGPAPTARRYRGNTHALDRVSGRRRSQYLLIAGGELVLFTPSPVVDRPAVSHSLARGALCRPCRVERLRYPLAGITLLPPSFLWCLMMGFIPADGVKTRRLP